MDLRQTKLTKEEWVSIERPVDSPELEIVKLIADGYSDVNVRSNHSPTLRRFLKIQDAKGIDDFIYVKYLQDALRKLFIKYSVPYTPIKAKSKSVKKADMIRFDNASKQLPGQKDKIFEYVVLELLEKLYKQRARKSKNWLLYYYTVSTVGSLGVETANRAFMDVVAKQVASLANEVDVRDVFKRSSSIVESNPLPMQFADISLYEHQRQLFTLCKRKEAKLISYVAPTGTGKTLSPLGLLGGHRVIFVCAARHVGLALAKAAISIHRKVAFAFGCGGAEDIRLHYFAAKEYTRNKRSGGIGKVDNTVGDNVEMIISDVRSYVYAMRYMLAFNNRDDLITYWDEPTISMDYDTHDFHDMIKRNWTENLIPNVVLSSATLPRPEDMMDTIMDYKARFMGAQHYSICSHECKKTVRLIDTIGDVVMPHTIAGSYCDLKEVVDHCRQYPTLFRYIDIEAAISFITYAEKQGYVKGEKCDFSMRFPDIGSVTCSAIKSYYLDVLESIDATAWEEISHETDRFNIKALDSWIHVLTTDAHTITNGPAIFIADDVAKIARFYLSEVDMPSAVLEDITATIGYNSVVNRKISSLEKDLEDLVGEDDAAQKPEAQSLIKRIEGLKNTIRAVMPPSMFVPNSKEHLRRFVPDACYDGAAPGAFTCDISEQIVEEVMLIPDVEDTWKILLLLGIGTFANHKSLRYLDVMRRLAAEQRLFMIIASGDYVYGTNYQFCHGYIGKDVATMSQEKCIQAMGRIGRGKQNHSYSIRFRAEELLEKLFHEAKVKPEANNMRRLFNS